jgi:bifunctional pyridoxal-dependent enzyme with beta-cystathionase and maltose regulon repressor activities
LYHDQLNSATIEGMLAAPGLKWHRDPPDVIPLWLADPDFPVAMEIKKALLNAVHDEDLFYNTDEPALAAMAEKERAGGDRRGNHHNPRGHPGDVARSQALMQ